MSVFLFIQPVAGALLGAYFLGDRITPFTIGGALLVLGAVALVNRRPLSVPAPQRAKAACLDKSRLPLYNTRSDARATFPAARVSYH